MKKWIQIVTAMVIAAAALPIVPLDTEAETTTYELTEDVQPRHLYTLSAENSLTINGTSANCFSTATGYSNVTKIETVQYLEKKTLWWWDEVDHWKRTDYTNYAQMTTGRTGLGSGTYRLRTVFTVYVGNNYETVEIISSSYEV